MKKISKILFSMCSFFMTGMGIERLYAATCTIYGSVQFVSQALEVHPWNMTGSYDPCNTEQLVGGVQDRNGVWHKVYECTSCKGSKKTQSLSIGSLFACTVEVTGCSWTGGSGGSTGGGSSTTSVTCTTVADCYASGKFASGYYDDGRITSCVMCSKDGYCYPSNTHSACAAYFAYECAPGYYKDADVSCRPVSRDITCCVECPKYENDYNSVEASVSSDTYTTSDIDKCRIWKTETLKDATGTWNFSTDCYYTE